MEAHLANGQLFIENESEFLHDIINSVGASIHIIKVDPQMNTLPIWMNNQYSKIMGYSFQERFKIGFTNETKVFYHPDDIEIIRKGIELVLTKREKFHVINFRVNDKDGNWKWLHVSAKAKTIDNDPNFILIVAIPASEIEMGYQVLLDRYYKEILQLKNEIKTKALSKTEIEVIRSLVSGLSTNEIAIARNRSYDTINNHKRNIFRKLQIHNLAELVAFAKECGIA